VLLREKLEHVQCPVVICTFKAAAHALLGTVSGDGWIPGAKVAEADVFVMPGPYARRERVASVLQELTARLRAEANTLQCDACCLRVRSPVI
jgi:hypothetical protein